MNWNEQDFHLQWHFGSGTVAEKKPKQVTLHGCFWCLISLYSHSQQTVVSITSSRHCSSFIWTMSAK